MNAEPVTPHSLEAERSVLGAILLNTAALGEAADVVGAADFFRHAHGRIFAACQQVHSRGQVVDLVTVKDALINAGELDDVGGPAYIASLIDGVPRSTNVQHYAAIVKEKARARRIIAYSTQAIETFTADPSALSNGAGSRFAEAIRREIDEAHAGADSTVSTPIADIITRIAEGRAARQPILGDLIALGEIAMLHGQPRDGKTWAALEIAVAVALNDTAFGSPRFRAHGAYAVLIVGNEDAEIPTAFRLMGLLAGRGIGDAPANIHTIIGQGCSLDDRVWQDRIIREAKRLGIRLIILDPLRSLSGCVDQGPHELQPLSAFLRRLARETGAAILIVHHDTKPLAAGVADTRRRAQRASGGAIFSIVDAPMAVERVDDHQSLIAPDGFKFCETPAAFVVQRTSDGPLVRLVAVDSGHATTATDLALREKIRSFLRDHPGSSGRAVTTGVRAHRELVTNTLEEMLQAGIVDAVDGARKARLWHLRG